VRVYRSLEDIAELPGRARAVAVGTFDGVHRGHQRIVGMAVSAAKSMQGVATVVTFEPHPDSVLRPESAPVLLTPLELKVALLEELGVNEVVAVPFDREFAALPPEDFCRRLLSQRLGARQVMVGANFRFGRRASGTPADLLAFGQEQGFSVTALHLVEEGGGPVSSTRIRALVLAGEVEAAARLLGRPHMLEGPVVGGARRGRTMGVPTANLVPPPGVAVPSLGVYVTRTIAGPWGAQQSVTSVGTNPTFESDDVVRIETFLLDFHGSLYSEGIRVEFLRRLRGQRTFPDAAALQIQMMADVAAAKQYFAERTGATGPPETGMW
jgi:riboflavin kinase / FMN adenylyltransferase